MRCIPCLHCCIGLKSIAFSVSDRKNKPSAVFLDKGVIKIKQTASQVWCLLRTLPLIIGEYIPEKDDMWAIFLMLRDITELLFCPVMTESLTYVVEHLVELHHEAYLKVCASFKNKDKLVGL